MLASLNTNEMKEMRRQQETVGWVCQYFDSGDEREPYVKRRARHGIAVNWPFATHVFYPKFAHLVQFLSDNTLGRIWYRMRKGETSLVQTCEYIVRQPGESFAGTDEGALIVNDPDTLTRDRRWRHTIPYSSQTEEGSARYSRP